MSPYLAEFIGTAILVLLGNGVVANVVLKASKGHGGGWIVIATGWGMAVAMAVYAVNHVSGAHINPAVTLSLAALGKIAWSLVPGYIAAQMAGAFVGAILVWLVYLPHWGLTESAGDKLGCFGTAPAVPQTGANFLAELIGTAVLIFGVLSFGQVGETLTVAVHAELGEFYGKAVAPLLVGLLVFSIGLSLGGPTGYAINPARDLGPRLAHALLPIAGKGGSDWGYAWIPIVGPIVGGLLGAWLYRLVGLGVLPSVP